MDTQNCDAGVLLPGLPKGLGRADAPNVAGRRAPTVRRGIMVPDRLACLLIIASLLSGQLGAYGGESASVVLSGHTDVVWSVAFSPDSKTLASASEDGTIRIWDIATKQPPHVLRGDGLGFRTLAFTPDAKRLVSGSGNALQLWDLRTWAQVRSLKGHTGDVTSVAISPKGDVLASASYDATVRLWDLRSGHPIRTLTEEPPYGHPVISIAFSPDGRSLVSGGEDAALTIWDVSTGAVRRLLGREKGGLFGQVIGEVKTVAWSSDGRSVASAGTANFRHEIEPDLKIALWDPETGVMRRKIGTGEGQFVGAIAFSPNGELLAAGTWRTYDVRLWRARTGAPVQTYQGHGGYILTVAFSPDGKLLASGDADTTVRLWPIVTTR